MDFFKKIWAWIRKAFFGYKKPKIIYPFTDDIDTWDPMQLEILRQFNLYRLNNNLGILKTDLGIRLETDIRCEQMAEAGTISHDKFGLSSERLKAKGLVSVGEIIAYGYSTADDVVHAWKNSPGHNKLILTSRYTHCGISTINFRNNTKIYCVIFGR